MFKILCVELSIQYSTTILFFFKFDFLDLSDFLGGKFKSLLLVVSFTPAFDSVSVAAVAPVFATGATLSLSLTNFWCLPPVYDKLSGSIEFHNSEHDCLVVLC